VEQPFIHYVSRLFHQSVLYTVFESKKKEKKERIFFEGYIELWEKTIKPTKTK